MDGAQECRLRPDGRFADEIRRIRISHGVVDNGGFIALSHGLTQVHASLSRLKDRGQLNINVHFQDIARNDPVNDRQLYELKTRLTDIFLQVVSTDSQVSVDLTVKQDDGGVLSALVNAMTLCLCYHGVPMVDMCVSVHLGECLDLCSKETGKGLQATVVYLVNAEKIVYFRSLGRCQRRVLESVLSSGVDCCRVVDRHFSEYLRGIPGAK